MSGALDGIYVLEVANFIAGPYAGGLLADLGAEVVKVERPEVGDPFRGWELGGDQPTFWAYNRGKKSVTLNLQEPEGRDIFLRLAADADVVLENMRPGAMDRLGLGYEQLRKLNPRLVYCAVTGFGPTGPYAERPAYDGVGQALSGLVTMLSKKEAPAALGPNFSDSIAGLFSAFGIVGALVSRERTGRGQLVEGSLVGSTVGFLVAPATETLSGAPPPDPLKRPRSSGTFCWVASDGLPFTVHLSSPPKFWQGLTRAAGRPELQEDPRFKMRPKRRENYELLRDELAATFRTQPRSYWLARLEAEDVPYAPVYDMAEVFADPHMQHLGLEIEIPRQNQPTIRTVANPMSFSETPCPHPAPPPELGEHTDQTLSRLGYDEAAIADLRSRKVI
jgi:formyl-CoA transferase